MVYITHPPSATGQTLLLLIAASSWSLLVVRRSELSRTISRPRQDVLETIRAEDSNGPAADARVAQVPIHDN